MQFMEIYFRGDKKEQLLDAIYKSATTSKDLFGRPLNLGKQLLLALNQNSQAKSIVSSSNMKSEASVTVSSTHLSRIRVVRVNPAALHAIRRMQRLIQVILETACECACDWVVGLFADHLVVA